jgi:hypothetical protein
VITSDFTHDRSGPKATSPLREPDLDTTENHISSARDEARSAGADLLTLITGIAMATEHHPDRAAAVDRLLGLVAAGVSP